MLDVAEVLWGERIGHDALEVHLHRVENPVPPDEGDEAQARLDAMLAT